MTKTTQPKTKKTEQPRYGWVKVENILTKEEIEKILKKLNRMIQSGERMKDWRVEFSRNAFNFYEKSIHFITKKEIESRHFRIKPYYFPERIFILAYFRHTKQWWEIGEFKMIDSCIKAIKNGEYPVILERG